MFTEDDGWYRATVINHSGNDVRLCYLDYGNTETLPLSRVKCLLDEFTVLPAQGFHARMDVPSGIDASSFEDSVLEKEFDAKIVKEIKEDVYNIELFSADGSKLFTQKPCGKLNL